MAPKGFGVSIRLDDEIPASEWETLSGLEFALSTQELLQDRVDALSNRRSREMRLYLIYLPDAPKDHPDLFGLFANLPFLLSATDGQVRKDHLSTIFVFKENVRQSEVLWIGEEQIETSTLVHEAGHFPGLVWNPAHKQPESPHCTNPTCVMVQPDWRSVLRNLLRGAFTAELPTRFDESCLRDIRLAREIWRSQAESLDQAPARDVRGTLRGRIERRPMSSGGEELGG